MVGAGQLARMSAEAASALGIDFAVLAEREGDPGALVSSMALLGQSDLAGMDRLRRVAEVLTFDHEQIDLDALASLENQGVIARPSSATLSIAVDKVALRERLSAARISMPLFSAVRDDGADSRFRAIEAFGVRHGWPLVVKPARGGYDGKGVFFVNDVGAALELCEELRSFRGALLIEELVDLDAEIAVLVVRGIDGEIRTWPVIRTIQEDGICRETQVPASLPAPVLTSAESTAHEVASLLDVVGILAVEMFVTGDGRLLVNEVAARPHNSGHWSIEGSITSQFENHLRAILAMPLGETATLAPYVVTVNVLGGDEPGSLKGALGVPGAHIHLYAKSRRRGRKLGHVTALGDDLEEVRTRAWAAARALGTPARVEKTT